MRIKRIKVKPIYPVNEWEILEDKFSVENNYRNETVFSLGNGYIGMRGNFEEGYKGPEGTGVEGTYLNGFFDSEHIKYAEIAYGYAEKSQTMLNVTNSKIIKLFLDDEEFNMFSGEVSDYKRLLNLKKGILTRSLVWTSPSGKKVKIEVTRVIPFHEKHLAVISYEVTPLNFSGEIKILSALDGKVQNLTMQNDPRVGSSLQGTVLSVEEKVEHKDYKAIIQRSKNTNFLLACAMKNQLVFDSLIEAKTEALSFRSLLGEVFVISAVKGVKVTLNKYISYFTSRDYQEKELISKATAVLNQAEKEGVREILRKQEEYLENFWYKTDVAIEGDKSIQQGLRINSYHLLQSVGRDGKTNIGAKGLTGEGYEGHYFWDTETYILSFFLFNNPEIARKLLEFRYNTLDKARKRAKEIGHATGALFPWRTIDGEECSTYFPAGTAQYHINADIAFAIKRYYDATEDQDFLINYGAEILFETARLWMDLGKYSARRNNRFCIYGVTGPDEYTAIVNNNCYTNMMAKENLEFAYRVAVWMQNNGEYDLNRKLSSEQKKSKNHKILDVYNKLAHKIELDGREILEWKKAAERMYIPYDQRLRIFPQDDSFLDKPIWDLEKTPAEKFPLLMNYHPLLLYKHQVCKQPDLVLALLLLSHKFNKSMIKRNYDYYEKITCHDSSLSPCIFSIVASNVDYYEKAYEYFMSTVRMDLDDYHGNTKDGIHAASMAGAWMCVVNGFAGMVVHDDIISFSPYLPKKWTEYRFKVTYRGRVLGVRVGKKGVEYELLEGEKISFYHRRRRQTLKRGMKIYCPKGLPNQDLLTQGLNGIGRRVYK